MMTVNILTIIFILIILMFLLIPSSRKEVKEEKVQFDIAVTAMNENELKNFIDKNKDKYNKKKLRGKIRKTYLKAIERFKLINS